MSAKGGKGQIISECIFDVFKFSKKPTKIWQISAPESKRWSNHKITAPYSVFNTLNSPHIIIVLQDSAFKLLIWPLFRSWAEICQIFRWFFGKFKNIKRTFWNYLTFTHKANSWNFLKIRSNEICKRQQPPVMWSWIWRRSQIFDFSYSEVCNIRAAHITLFWDSFLPTWRY